MQKAQHKNMRWCVVAGLLVLLPGCGFVQPKLPPEVAFVVDNEETFLSDPEQVPAETTPGALVDDLEGLTGCWGTVRLPDSEIPVKLYSVYHFDAEAGEFKFWGLQEDPWGLGMYIVLSLNAGTYEIFEGSDNEQAINMVITETWVDNPFTGELEQEQLDPREDIAILTLDGELLYEWLGEPSSDEVSPDAAWLVYRRFECPEAED